MANNICNTSKIHPSATIGENVTVGSFCIIEENVIIGDNVSIGDFAIIRKNARIGNNCRFTAYCEIRNNVVVGQNTRMGSRCTISANAKIGSNVVIKYAFVLTDTPNLSKDNEKAVKGIGDGVLIGANVTLMPNCSIGDNSVIGACSQVRCDIPPGEIWYGSPAIFHKKTK